MGEFIKTEQIIFRKDNIMNISYYSECDKESSSLIITTMDNKEIIYNFSDASYAVKLYNEILKQL